VTVLDWAEAAARMFEPKDDAYPTPGVLAAAVTPGTLQTRALDVIDQALVDVESGDCDRLIISMPPQEGKSTRVTKVGPLWFLLRNPERRVVVASYAESLAQEFGRDIRSHITSNQGDDGTLDLGLRIAPDNGAVTSWKLDQHRGGVRSVGIAGGLTGRPADVIFIDDPISNMEQAESKTYRDRAWSFWTSVARTRLAPGAPVVLILTRWHHDDLAGRLLRSEEGHRWRVINIPAQANHRPEKGEVDPLGREPGEWMDSARTDERTGKQRTAADWEASRREVGPRVWNALYQGNPSPEQGGLFPGVWARYEQPMWIEHHDGTRTVPGEGYELVQSWDMTFKDTKASDYVVGQVWLRIGVTAYLLDQVRARMNFTATIEAEGSKFARASAVSPLSHSGNIVLPSAELLPNVEELIEEHRLFPNGPHDDTVDTLSQAINRLLLNPLLEHDDIIDGEDLLDIDPHDYLGGY